MRISLALAAMALCFSTVGCACPRCCPYMGYPIPPRMAMLEEPDEFPDAPPAKPAKAEKKGEKAEQKAAPQVTTRKSTANKPAQVATRAGVVPAKKSAPTAKPESKPQVAAKPAAEKSATQLLATTARPTVRATAASKPANFTPVAHGRPIKPAQQANSGLALASVIEVAPPSVARAKPAAKAAEPVAEAPAAPRLKQPAMVRGRGAKPAGTVAPKQEEPKKPQLQAGETPTGARQVVHLEAGK